MAGQTLTLSIVSSLEKAGFTEAAAQMRKLQTENENLTTKTERWDKALKNTITTIKAAGVTLFYIAAANEAGRAEQAQLRLQTAVENTGMSWDRVSTAVSATNAALSLNSRFAKGDLDNALGILIQRTNSLAVSQANLRTVMGVSVATGRTLADVADQIGRAANGSQRDIMQLAKEFGITGKNAKDADFVLEELSKRFGSLGTETSSWAATTGQLSSAWGDLKETFGFLVGGALIDIQIGFTRLMRVVTAVLQVLVDLNKVLAFSSKVTFFDRLGAWNQAGEDFKKIWTAAFGALPKLAEEGGRKTTEAARKMGPELLALLNDLNSKTAQIMGDIGATEEQKIRNRTDFEKQQITQRVDFEILAEQDKLRVLTALNAKANAEIAALNEERAKKVVATTSAVGQAAGIATAKMLQGQAGSWQEFTKKVIDLATSAAIAGLNVFTAAEVAKKLVAEDYYGAARAAAVGALQVGVVAAAGELAKGLVGEGAGSSASGLGSSTATASPSSAPASAPAAQEKRISINIYGDVTSDPAIMDSLIQRISDRVENADVRLVATQTSAAGA